MPTPANPSPKTSPNGTKVRPRNPGGLFSGRNMLGRSQRSSASPATDGTSTSSPSSAGFVPLEEEDLEVAALSGQAGGRDQTGPMSPTSIMVSQSVPHTPSASPRGGPTWPSVLLGLLHHWFAFYGVTSVAWMVATRGDSASVDAALGSAAIAAAATLALLGWAKWCSDNGYGDHTVGAFANPLWRTKSTWRNKPGGVAGSPEPRRTRHIPSLDASRAAHETMTAPRPPPAKSPPKTAAAAATESARLVASGVRLSEVQLLAVPHLGKVLNAPENADNMLGSGELHDYLGFTGVADVILGDIVRTEQMEPRSRAFLRAGPRRTLYFEPTRVRAAVVTCGGLCPGLNNIIREVTKSLLNLYSAEAVLGVRGGYWGFREDAPFPPIELTHEAVAGIQQQGGTILGSARGGFDVDQVLSFCKARRVSQLYIVGGDGTHRAANQVGLAALERRVNVTVAGIPKTIDNDLDLVDRSFGFESAVEAAQAAIRSASTEAKGNVPNGIGIVKLMGRHAGFIAAHATLAAGDVDLCLVPEVPIELEGMYGVLPHLERVLEVKGKAVIVVAEGAGEDLCGAAATVDAGGNKALPEIGPFIKDAINKYFKSRGTTVNVKYIDPSYMIRSVAANAADSQLCMQLAQNAVHGSMAGHTCFTTGLCNNRMVYLPIPALVEHSPRGLRRGGRTLERVISITGQPHRSDEASRHGSRSSSPEAARPVGDSRSGRLSRGTIF
jgi:6-phosphofructokinase 1